MDLNTITEWVANSFKYWAMGLIVLIVVTVRKKITDWAMETVWKKIKMWFKKSHILNRQQIMKDTQIHDLLIELRVHNDSDRTALYQFHNGINFSSKSAGWRVSCPSESIANGVGSEVGFFQNIISSCIIDIISCLWETNLPAGVEKISPAVCTCSNNKTCTIPKGIYLISVEKLNEGYAKSFLQKQGIVYFLVSPVLNNDNRIGFIGVSYCSAIPKAQMLSKGESICKYAHTISYLLHS